MFHLAARTRSTITATISFALAWSLSAATLRGQVAPAPTVVSTSVKVMDALMSTDDEPIPARLLAGAHGVAIIPDVVKGGLVVGVRRGHGVLMLRGEDGQWQRPFFVTLTGASVGWQIGLQATDLVLVFKNRRSIENLMRGKMTIGVDASAAAGPVGRKASAATDGRLAAEIYSYSRSRGLFAGVSLDGARIELDRRAHAAYYRHMPNETSAPAEAITLINRLNQYSVVGRQGAPNLRQPAQPRAAATVAAELSVAHRSLQTLLDERWRQFLALPGTGQQGQVRVTLEQWQTALDRFNEVARNPSFINLNQRQEFLSTHKLLQEYVEGMRPKTGRVSLPPPPNLTR